MHTKPISRIRDASKRVQDMAEAAAARVRLLSAVAHARGFAARLAPCLHAVCRDVGALDAAHDVPALEDGLQLILQTLCDASVKLAFPDVKDVCAALLGTLPSAPVDAGAQLPSGGSAGTYSPDAARLRCHVMALQGLLAVLTAFQGSSAPWLTLHCSVLQRSINAIQCLASEARCTAMPLMREQPGMLSADPALEATGTSAVGVAAQLCSCVVAAHHGQLTSCAARTAMPADTAANAAALTGSLPRLLALLCACAAELLFPHTQTSLACQLVADEPPFAAPAPQQATAAADAPVLWRALADIMDVALAWGPNTLTPAAGAVCASARQAVARGLLRELLPCAPLPCSRAIACCLPLSLLHCAMEVPRQGARSVHYMRNSDRACRVWLCILVEASLLCQASM